jgi:perosamine synthetase
VKKPIPHSRPFLGGAEKAACLRVISSGQLSQGGEVSSLEKELSSLAGHRFGIAVSSGTAALFLALKTLGVKRGDTVVIPSYVCTALLNAVYLTGAKPLLSDVDPLTGNINSDLAKKAARSTTKAVIAPHLFGTPLDARSIEKDLGIPVIEDCAQCLGTTVGNKKVGGLTTVSVFSFYATKLLCAGEGGMIATSDKRLAAQMTDYREYDNRDYYIPSFNIKLSDLHAAIARQQLKKLPAMISRRRQIARKYISELKDLASITLLPLETRLCRPVYYRFVLQTGPIASVIIRKMDRMGIACRKPVYRPLHHYLKQTGFPGADEIFRRAVSVPIYPGLDNDDIPYIITCLKRILKQGVH